MSIAVEAEAARRSGRHYNYHERPVLNTLGHSSSEGGLRGHSVGETFPYRVVIMGDGACEVHSNAGREYRCDSGDFELNHQWASQAARRFKEMEQ